MEGSFWFQFACHYFGRHTRTISRGGRSAAAVFVAMKGSILSWYHMCSGTHTLIGHSRSPHRFCTIDERETKGDKGRKCPLSYTNIGYSVIQSKRCFHPSLLGIGHAGGRTTTITCLLLHFARVHISSDGRKNSAVLDVGIG